MLAALKAMLESSDQRETFVKGDDRVSAWNPEKMGDEDDGSGVNSARREQQPWSYLPPTTVAPFASLLARGHAVACEASSSRCWQRPYARPRCYNAWTPTVSIFSSSLPPPRSSSLSAQFIVPATPQPNSSHPKHRPLLALLPNPLTSARSIGISLSAGSHHGGLPWATRRGQPSLAHLSPSCLLL